MSHCRISCACMPMRNIERASCGIFAMTPCARFWLHEFEHYHFRQRADAVAPIQNKLGALLSDPTLYRILVGIEDRPAFPLNDGRGRVPAGQSLQRAAWRRQQQRPWQSPRLHARLGGVQPRRRRSVASRRPFFIYLDEFQNFTTLRFANMMAELRKYGVGLIVNVHQ